MKKLFALILAMLMVLSLAACGAADSDDKDGGKKANAEDLAGDILDDAEEFEAFSQEAVAHYLKAYGIDCLLTPIFFCATGFFNGFGKTRFVMAQGILSAFCVRIPVSWLMSRRRPVSLFHIGLATPCSSLLQIVMCTWYLLSLRRQGVFRIPERAEAA